MLCTKEDHDPDLFECLPNMYCHAKDMILQGYRFLGGLLLLQFLAQFLNITTSLC